MHAAVAALKADIDEHAQLAIAEIKRAASEAAKSPRNKEEPPSFVFRTLKDDIEKLRKENAFLRAKYASTQTELEKLAAAIEELRSNKRKRDAVVDEHPHVATTIESLVRAHSVEHPDSFIFFEFRHNNTSSNHCQNRNRVVREFVEEFCGFTGVDCVGGALMVGDRTLDLNKTFLENNVGSQSEVRLVLNF